MIEIEVSKDIKAHEVKLIGPFTGRQLICIGVSLTYGIPLLVLLPGSFMVKSIITLVLMMPTIMCGWSRIYGMPLEKFAMKAIKSTLRSNRRLYITRNRYSYLAEKDYNKPVERVNRSQEGGIL